MKNNNQITKLQLITFIIQTQIGVAFLSLPFDTYKFAKGDSWISLLITGVVMQVLVFFYFILSNRFPKQDLFQILQSLLGRFVGKCLTLFYFAYFLLTGATILILFVYIIKKWMLPYTPYWVILLLMCAIGIYLAIENLTVIARFYFIAMIVLFFFIFVTPMAIKDGNIHYIMPIGHSGVWKILNGSAHATLAWQGLELFLIVSPFVPASSKEKLKAVTLANIFVTLLYTFLTFVCLIYFSGDEISLMPQPVLYLLKSFSFTIIERPDIVIISLWIILVGTSFVSYLYGASLAATFVIKKWKRQPFVYLAALFCFIFALFFNGEKEIEKLTKFTTNIGFIFLMAMPVFLLLISLLFKKQQRGDLNAKNN
ncbi:GerAB/ArcD/ProY family transporter [Neobacillus mesonae]|uniref:GerAB/ArcD/ProY family transporter n=1 Tax=Neobacillus mesonae TaxID=1193713 RepID=UPI00082B6241|nr:GerAB/ArcD/ProY family transporter [Neobacillus mesonae]MED4203906.1 GerAB/ArcD/ProY family transporter [Neobacillus mesonae]